MKMRKYLWCVKNIFQGSKRASGEASRERLQNFNETGHGRPAEGLISPFKLMP